MSKPTATSPGCECEICGNISRNCRDMPEIKFCMTFADAKKGEIINGSTNQESRISELSNCISRHQLTNSLEHLEQCGFSGDTAIFILACLQGGVA